MIFFQDILQDRDDSLCHPLFCSMGGRNLFLGYDFIGIIVNGDSIGKGAAYIDANPHLAHLFPSFVLNG
jgi:hypothetical protein